MQLCITLASNEVNNRLCLFLSVAAYGLIGGVLAVMTSATMATTSVACAAITLTATFAVVVVGRCGVGRRCSGYGLLASCARFFATTSA